MYKRKFGIAAAAITFLVTSNWLAKGACEDSPYAEIKNCQLQYAPNASLLGELVSLKARRDHIPGNVLLECVVTEQLAFNECVVLDEAPLDYGFGEAAINISKTLRSKANMADGAPSIGSRCKFRFSVKYN